MDRKGWTSRPSFDEAAEAWPQLNKLANPNRPEAFWMATGSATTLKTLLMHANILQYFGSEHALPYIAVEREAPSRTARQREIPEPRSPGLTLQRRALAAASARVRGGGHRRSSCSTRTAAGCSAGRRSKSSK